MPTVSSLFRALHAVVVIHLCSAWGFGSFHHQNIHTCRTSSLTRCEAAADDSSPTVTGVTLKIAVDSQGGVADLAAVESDRFTSPSSLDRVHRLRRDSQAVLIGRGTVVFDNPSLTVRRNVPPLSPPPLRIVLDSRLSLLIDRVEKGRTYKLFEDGLPTIVYHSLDDVDEQSLNLFETITLVQVPSDLDPKVPYLDVSAVWKDLLEYRGVSHLMVEGGPATARSFLAAGLVDRVILVKAENVTFRKPVPSGITEKVLQAAGLECAGSFEEDGDTTECWVRPGESWPAPFLSGWP
eukprot:scaffold1995_cov167-Amphora_coffeaeformis.AAC.16